MIPPVATASSASSSSSSLSGAETAAVEVLLSRFDNRTAQVAILGLGYVGIPLALALLRAGFTVLGLDPDADKVAALMAGRSVIRHIPDSAIAEAVASGRFSASTDSTRLVQADAILICVPTPLTRHREPDLHYVIAATETVAASLRHGQLVVLESTTYPGTTNDVMRPILERQGLRSGTDFFLAYSPEREDPANPDFDTARIPKVVGGDGAVAGRLAVALYRQIVSQVVPMSSSAAAEAVKLTENIFRAVNISLVNELKVIFDAMGLDVWEVIEGAKTKPFGYMPFYPGPGLGGHCIPIDPFYLTWKAREYDVPTRFIELAGEINTGMPHYVVRRLAEALDARCQRGLSGARILLLGVAYKKNVDDLRESPALKLTRLLESRGAEVLYHDPFLPEIPFSHEHPELNGRASVSLDAGTLNGVAAVLICTDHDAVDYRLVVAHAPLVVDTRNVCARLGLPDTNVVKA